MKLSKPNEDTLKGIAKFLKELKDPPLSNPDSIVNQAKALEKDLRQFRASIKDMPEPGGVVTGDGTGTVLPEAPVEMTPGTLEGVVACDETPVIFVNPAQLEAKSNLIAVRPEEQGVFLLALYRKK